MKPSRPRRFDLVVFDWDGTLFDSTQLIVRCIQAACRDLGVAAPDDARAAYVIGLGLHDALQHAVPGLPAERYPELGRRYRHHYTAQQHALVLFPGILELLQMLKSRNHLLAVATGKGRRGLDEALSHVQLQALFDGSRTADETASKPHPLMLQQLMDEFGVPAQRCLMIGDTVHDLQLARNAGTASVAVSYGADEAPALSAHAPLFLAPSPADLHRWLAEHA